MNESSSYRAGICMSTKIVHIVSLLDLMISNDTMCHCLYIDIYKIYRLYIRGQERKFAIVCLKCDINDSFPYENQHDTSGRV